MKNRFISKFTLLVFISLLSFFSTANANEGNGCDFQLYVVDAETGEGLEEYTVKHIGIKETDYLEIESKYSVMRFTCLSEQRYEIEVSKKNYGTSIFFLDCFAVQDQKTIHIEVPMWKVSEDKTDDVNESFLDFNQPTGKLMRINYNPNSKRRIPKSKKRELKKDKSLGLKPGKPIYIEKPKPKLDSNGQEIRGSVQINISIDIYGKVKSAKAVSGPKELHDRAVSAALQSVFEPSISCGKPIQVASQITYIF